MSMNQNNISLEKVIKGLECCSVQSVDRDCDVCPIGFGEGCALKLKRDALALLKAQEPRLVTEGDLENADEYGVIPVWCEETDKDCYWNCVPRAALETAKEDGCRYWTAKPSLKQMEETPWA